MSELLQNHNFQFQKKYGQNFLTDVKIPRRISMECTDFEFSDDSDNPAQKSDSMVLEVGPGAGILTKELAKRFKKVVAVEIDENLRGVLEESLAGYDNISVVFNDVMKLDLPSFIEENSKVNGTRLPVSVCANLPYYITTPIIMKLLEEYPHFDFITVMVQKEVAARLCAKPGSPEYGAITAQINLFGNVKRLFTVPSGCFYPRPKIDSAVIRIALYEKPLYTAEEISGASKLIKAAFSMRRKTLSNSIFSCVSCDKATLEDIIDKALGMGKDVRGERLSSADFVALSASLGEFLK